MHMPKLNSRPHKYCKVGKYDVVYHQGKTHYLGLHGSKESKTAFSRFLAKIQASPTFFPSKGEKCTTICELSAAFLDHAKTSMDSTTYSLYRVIVRDFLNELYGDDTPVDKFTPRCLTLVRDKMIQSGRYCRRIVNRYTSRIISIFKWGVKNELVPETTW